MNASEIINALKYYFGYENFRNAQGDVVLRLLNGEDLCVVMPTGAGKSICYQLPILMRTGYGLVISPLIALMKDQVDALNARKMNAIYINSMMSQTEQQNAIYAIFNGYIKFVYVAPERFRSTQFRQLLQSYPPSMVVIDEAHCISQWGHDFRPDYQTIWTSTPELSSIQLAAFTATATPLVREDIKRQLNRPNMAEVISGFKRQNLNFSVRHTDDKDAKINYIADILKNPEPTIIYTATRKDTDLLAKKFNIVPYHAGMNESERRKAQDYFMKSPCPILAATNAFGMGIDRQDIRHVVHYSIPQSLEAYYQEAGRAGRDGKPANCTLLYAYRDLKIQEYMLELNNPAPELILKLHREIFKRTQNFPGMPIFAYTLKQIFSDEKTGAIETALRQLERLGYIIFTRTPSYNCGFISFKYPLDSQIYHNTETVTQRSIFLHTVTTYMLANQISTLNTSIAHLSYISKLREDQVKNVITALNTNVLEWEIASNNDESVVLTEKGNSKNIDIEEKNLISKQKLDQQRLDAVKHYCELDSQCRQLFIINYFGEKVNKWKCGICDNCTHTNSNKHAKHSRDDSIIENIILDSVSLFNGRFGKSRIIDMLTGEEDTSNALMSCQYFGKFSGTNRKVLYAIISRMLASGQLQIIQQNGYPCIAIPEQ